MKHMHHIIPKHMGGTDDPSNLIELTVEEHSQAHYKLYEQYGKTEDLCAYYMLSGKNQDPEFVKLVASLGGTAAYNKRKKLGISHLSHFGANLSEDEKFSISSAGGKIQGKKNAESGHMKKIQKLSNSSENGRKGAEICRERKTNSFFDPELKKEIASKGGKIQGKKNAESGHLKRIAQLPNERNSGAKWITNGTLSKTIKPHEQMPEGYYYGRVCSRKEKKIH